jgi:hypothetical protein
MQDWYLIIAIIVTLIILMIIAKYVIENRKLTSENEDLKKLNGVSQSNYLKLRKDMDDCLKIKFADENIMYYVRCINDPRKKVCKDTGSSNDICRSRFQDCSKMRGILEADPVAIKRMEMLNFGV